jgi:polyhydroxybutyrate depolymerase
MHRRFDVLASVFALVTLAGCSHASSSASNGPAIDAGGGGDAGVVGQRPYTLVVPDSYDASKPAPLVVMFHGYGVTGSLEELVFQMTATAQAHGFLYAYGDGTPDSSGARFWNATDACCDLEGIPVDDVAYFDAIVDDVASKYAVDPKRVYVIGHSNGGFMSHRLACDRASRVAAIVSLAGAQWIDPSRCSPSEPVAVAQAHGDADQVILYDGGATDDRKGGTHPYPSAAQTVATWASKDGCTPSPTTAGTMDLDTSLPGAETTVERYAGCTGGANVELWTIHGAGHVPSLGPSWGESVWTFLSAHPKP